MTPGTWGSTRKTLFNLLCRHFRLMKKDILHLIVFTCWCWFCLYKISCFWNNKIHHLVCRTKAKKDSYCLRLVRELQNKSSLPPQAVGGDHKPLTHLVIFTQPVLVALETARSTQGQYTSGPSHIVSPLLYLKTTTFFICVPLASYAHSVFFCPKSGPADPCAGRASPWEKWNINNGVCQFSNKVGQCALPISVMRSRARRVALCLGNRTVRSSNKQ